MRVDRELGRVREPLYMRVAAVAFWLVVWELGARALGATLGVCFILEGLDSILSGWLTGR